MLTLRQFILSICFVALVGISSRDVLAGPTFGANCATCHYTTSGKFSVVSGAKTNLGTTRLDKQKPGALQTFTVRRGKTVQIPIKVTNGSAVYAVGVANFTGGGLKSSRANQLLYTVGAGFVGGGSPLYYVSSTSGTPWSGRATTINFPLTIKKNAKPDYYELYIRVGGIDQTGRWVQVQRIYIRVT